ncbi:MAG TPA: DNA-binding response regulator, partial [Porphyromonadaceae bacterium]|nr:DNA-binding response regulator [Porphyromonadaceae bacterium]
MKCIIIDDEPIARKGMKRLVDSRNELELLASFGNAETAEEFLEDNDVDLIFLDIKMPEIKGIEFAGRIPRKCLVIFTTAYSEYALDSYEV